MIYQGDVRARQEHAPRVLADAQNNHAEALVKNWPTHYDYARPWNTVWKMLCEGERDWWDVCIHRPLNRVLSGSAVVQEFIDGDVLTRTNKRPRADF